MSMESVVRFLVCFSCGWLGAEYVKNYTYRQDRMVSAMSFLASCPINTRCCACQSEDCKKYECVGGAADGGMGDGSVGTGHRIPVYQNPSFPVRFVNRDDAGLSWCLVGDGGQCIYGWCACANPECTKCRGEVDGPR